MPAVNHVEGLICRWLLWTGINACSASHFVTANAVPSASPAVPPPLPLLPPLPLPRRQPDLLPRSHQPPVYTPSLLVGSTFPNNRYSFHDLYFHFTNFFFNAKTTAARHPSAIRLLNTDKRGNGSSRYFGSISQKRQN